MTRKDIIREAIDWLLANDEQFTQELALRFEREMRSQWGGVDNRPWKTPEGRPGRPAKQAYDPARAYADGLGNEPTETVTRRHGVSRATLYRLMKRGPGTP